MGVLDYSMGVLDYSMGVLDYSFPEFVRFITNQCSFSGEENRTWIKSMGIKKPVPREGRVVFARVVKLVNTGDCHSPGLCSKSYMPYGFEARPGQPKVMPVSYMDGALSNGFGQRVGRRKKK